MTVTVAGDAVDDTGDGDAGEVAAWAFQAKSPVLAATASKAATPTGRTRRERGPRVDTKNLRGEWI
ncbi:hypothetical protein ACFQ10_50640 [Streptomyces indonesiensis]|uniref:Uncharacterized protein n=2 Tax=Streptomyces rhizosphaericus TaxID=114699 RepID=A0ABN1QHU6_9ACTN